MKPKQLLGDYLSGKISGEELRTWLSKDKCREARNALEILNMDDACRNALADFAPPSDAPERLAGKISAVESWIPPMEEAEEPQPSRRWVSRLIPAFDVAGHSKPDARPKKRRKSTARKKARSRKKPSTRSKEKT